MGFGINDIKSIFERPKSAIPSVGGQNKAAVSPDSLKSEMNDIYKVEQQNWYSAKPYGFKMNTREGGSFVFFLPISPSNLTISTPFATNIVPTLYGTVEEHSDVRYYDIAIEGTTGMAPKYVEPGAASDMAVSEAALREKGRKSFEISQGLALGGFFSKTLGILNQAKEKAADLLDGGVKPKTGVHIDKSGYVAFHNLYRFLLKHKKDASGTGGSSEQRQQHPLIFFNYKDNNQYYVVVRNFTLRRSAENPMLYMYSIQLRGYNLEGIGKQLDDDLANRLQTMGLDGVDASSILGDIKDLSTNAKAVVGSIIGGKNILGR